jgi:SpoVK/Ycf46/Vps4 family AAA+-type ATPase
MDQAGPSQAAQLPGVQYTIESATGELTSLFESFLQKQESLNNTPSTNLRGQITIQREIIPTLNKIKDILVKFPFQLTNTELSGLSESILLVNSHLNGLELLDRESVLRESLVSNTQVWDEIFKHGQTTLSNFMEKLTNANDNFFQDENLTPSDELSILEYPDANNLTEIQQLVTDLKIEVTNWKTIKTTFNDIIGNDTLKRKLQQRSHTPIDSRKPIILWGPPGSGKNSVLDALAQNDQKHILLFGASSILSSLQGGSESNVNKAIKLMKFAGNPKANFIVVGDEIEALFGDRQKPNPGLPSAATIVGTFLSKLDEMGNSGLSGNTYFTTNYLNAIDPAILRRLEEIQVTYPTKQEAGGIFFNIAKLYNITNLDSATQLPKLNSFFTQANGYYSPAKMQSIISDSFNNTNDMKVLRNRIGYSGGLLSRRHDNVTIYDKNGDINELLPNEIIYPPSLVFEDVYSNLIKSTVALTPEEAAKYVYRP